MSNLTSEELKERQQGLGGSDALAYAGLDPTYSPLELWREKLGEAAPRELGERADWGSRLEPVVRDWLAEEIGRRIYKPASVYRSNDVPMMLGHLDGVTMGPPEGVEIKTTDKFMAKEFGEVETDQVPIRYVLQVTHYMIVTGLKRFHIGALIGGNEARHYVVDWDPELAGMLIQRARAFWQHVTARTPPDPVNLADAAIRWPRSEEKFIKANDSIVYAVEELKKMRRAEREAKASADSLELTLKAFMGSSALLTDDRGHKLATWRQQTRESFDAKTFSAQHPDLAAQFRRENTFRVFLVK